jgi:hypothetical protein
MVVRQNILISNSNKSNSTNLSNDIQLKFPSTLFFKAPQVLELVSYDLNNEIGIFGNTNNVIIISYIDNTHIYRSHVVTIETFPTTTTDYLLAQDIKTSLNNYTYINYPLVFNVQESTVELVLTNFLIERDSTTTVYTITCNLPCTISFQHKDSIGPLIGFGNGIYSNTTIITGSSTQSITTYHYIDVYNESGSTTPAVYPNYNDINCKMALFDSTGTYIINPTNNNDLTISLNTTVGLSQYKNIEQILLLIENAMNNYSGYFTPAAVFKVSYSYENKKIKIINTSGAKFGIGFDFTRINIPNGGLTSGSMHSILGFKQKSYINLTEIVSDEDPLIFEDAFADDYLLICSNITAGASDINTIGIGSGNNIKNNNALFSIPLRYSKHFIPTNINAFRINISNSPFSLGYKNKKYSDANPNIVNFYLRLLSGRHIPCNSYYTMQLAFEY